METILIVGNEPLGPWGPGVKSTHVWNAAQALEELVHQTPDAAVVCTYGPIQGDVDLVRALVGQDIPTIVVGPDGDLARAKEVLLAGASDYLERSDLDPSTLSMSVQCARVPRLARGPREWAERDRSLRQALIDQLADRLHNPMTVLMIQVRLLKSRLSGEDAMRLQRLEDATQRIRRTVHEVTDAYRMQSGRMDIVVSEVDLWSMHLASRRGTGLPGVQWKEHGGPLLARTDAHHVARIMDSMLHQACDIASEGSVIHVCLTRERDEAVYTVTVDEPRRHVDADAMFEAFAGMEDLTRCGDLGLSLYTSRLSAQGLRGDLTALGGPQGLRFTLRLPLSRAAPIVIIDGDASVRDKYRVAAHQGMAQHRMVVVPSWQEAQFHLGSESPQHVYVGRPEDIPPEVLMRVLEHRGWPATRLTQWLEAPMLQEDSTA